MKAVTVTEHGSSDVLKVVDVDLPEPGRGEVQVRTAAVGVNFADIKRRRGDVARLQETPYSPGIEAAGTVEVVGEGVDLEVGDRVAAHVGEGTYAEAFVADTDSVFVIPDELSFDDAAGFTVQFITAYNCLHGWGHVESDEKVLVHAAAGGVGSAAVQLANIAGAEVFATASSDEKLTFASELGADHCINYIETDFVAVVNEITDENGVDLVLDGVGGETFNDSVDTLAPFGRIVSIGSASGADGQVNPSPLRKQNASVIGYHFGKAMEADPDRIRPAVQDLFNLLLTDDLTVIVDKTFSLENAAAAHASIEDRQSRGKILLHP